MYCFKASRFPIVLAVLLLATAFGGQPARAADPPMQIWFSPLAGDLKPGGGGIEYVEHDFPAMLRPNAPWQTAASRISVMQLPGNLVWSYPDIPSVVGFLRAHPWKVALVVSVMFDGGRCPKRLEGFSRDSDFNHEAVTIAQRWKQDGGSLDYITMDSPLWFGHYQEKTCIMPTAEVAQRTAATLRGMLAYFPNAKIVDADGPGWIRDEEWLPETAAFFADIRADLGHPINGIALDLHWRDLRPGYTWQTTARRSAAYFHRLGMSVGLLANADGGPGVTDQSWMAANRQHLSEAAQARLGLDFVMLSEWQRDIRHNLPENDPNAYASLIDDAYKDFYGAR